MYFPKFSFVVVSAIALMGAAAAPAQAARGRTFSIDAVELVKNGKEVDGDRKHSVARDGYTYYFASEKNKAAFEAEPARYEIQMGGACARMGPLSGGGSVDIYAVHDGRLYIFASPQCREGFLRAPEKQIDTEDPPVKADAAARKRGMELIELAVKAHGGAEAIDAAMSYRQTLEESKTSNGKRYDSRYTLTVAFPDRIRDESCWNRACSSYVVRGAKGAEYTHAGFDKPMAEAQVRALKRKANVNPLSILKARARPDFVAAKVDAGYGKDGAIERVAVSYDGMMRILGIDAKSGRIRTLSFKGRGGERNEIGTLLRTYGDYDTAGGITLPVSWTTAFNGGEPDAKPAKLTKVEVNADVTDKQFAVEPAK